jgi:formyltetrahydrofolate hydrolase
VGERAQVQTWITVNCRDRSGILADVALTFAKYGLNILVRPSRHSLRQLPSTIAAPWLQKHCNGVLAT